MDTNFDDKTVLKSKYIFKYYSTITCPKMNNIVYYTFSSFPSPLNFKQIIYVE